MASTDYPRETTAFYVVRDRLLEDGKMLRAEPITKPFTTENAVRAAHEMVTRDHPDAYMIRVSNL